MTTAQFYIILAIAYLLCLPFAIKATKAQRTKYPGPWLNLSIGWHFISVWLVSPVFFIHYTLKKFLS